MKKTEKLTPKEHVFYIKPEGNHIADSEQFIQRTFEKNREEGFELLFRRYYAVLCNHALRFVWSKEVAKDIVSEVFMNFWKSHKTFEIEKSYRSYLFRAVRNRSYNYLTREFDKTVPIEGSSYSAINLHNPEKIILFDELQFKIEKEISELPSQCQKVFKLNRLDGKKNKEIAEELDISIKTVEMHLTRALKLLRAALKEHL